MDFPNTTKGGLKPIANHELEDSDRVNLNFWLNGVAGSPEESTYCTVQCTVRIGTTPSKLYVLVSVHIFSVS